MLVIVSSRNGQITCWGLTAPLCRANDRFNSMFKRQLFVNTEEKAVEKPITNSQGAAMHDPSNTLCGSDCLNDRGRMDVAIMDAPRSIIPRKMGCDARINLLSRRRYTQNPPNMHARIKRPASTRPTTRIAVGIRFNSSSSRGSDESGTVDPSL
mmetsp:Transcript_9978/g.23094  ORF Transcript_9978/g.23094 Transcript_9978/m.23094 type:complete len:154 (+) Transcript_9978:1052-1513(+)